MPTEEEDMIKPTPAQTGRESHEPQGERGSAQQYYQDPRPAGPVPIYPLNRLVIREIRSGPARPAHADRG